MNLTEYEAQTAVGTVDFLQAAINSKDPEVLMRIIDDSPFDINLWNVIAGNPHTNGRTLTRIISDREADDMLINTCVWHPAVTPELLKTWSQRGFLCDFNAIKQRILLFRLRAGENINRPTSARLFTKEYYDLIHKTHTTTATTDLVPHWIYKSADSNKDSWTREQCERLSQQMRESQKFGAGASLEDRTTYDENELP